LFPRTKKRIRGWKRRLRKVDEWKRKVINIDLEHLNEVYESWCNKLKKTNEEFYLKIWLYEPNFINSQIVAAYKECLHTYDKTFDFARNEKKFPFDKYTYLKDKLEMFNWSLHIDSDVFTESDLIDNIQRGWISEDEFKVIKSKAYSVDIIKLSGRDTDKVYSVKVGDVWVGSIKNT
jgi:hypothetical protein